MARVSIICDLPHPTRTPVPRVDGRPVTRRPRIGLGLRLRRKPNPNRIAAKTEAIRIMLADVLADRAEHPVTQRHIRTCPPCRKRKRSLYRQALRRMTR